MTAMTCFVVSMGVLKPVMTRRVDILTEFEMRDAETDVKYSLPVKSVVAESPSASVSGGTSFHV